MVSTKTTFLFSQFRSLSIIVSSEGVVLNSLDLVTVRESRFVTLLTLGQQLQKHKF